MKGLWFWTGLVLFSCTGKTSTDTHDGATSASDADTDADSDSDADSDADSDSGTSSSSGSGTTQTSGLLDGEWAGSCLPTNPNGVILKIDVDLTLTQIGSDVAGLGQVTYYIDEPSYTGYTYTGYTYTGYTYTYTGYTPYTSYTTGSYGYTPYTTVTGGSGTTWTIPGGSYFTSGSYYSTGYTTTTGVYTTYTIPGGSGFGTGNTFVEVLPATVKGLWDVTSSRLQAAIDIGYPPGDNPRTDGTIVSNEWTATWSWPLGYPQPYECTINLK